MTVQPPQPVCVYLRTAIKQYLASTGKSIRWLAKKLGTSYGKIYRLETGEATSVGFERAHMVLKFIEPDTYRLTLAKFFPDMVDEITDQDSEIEKHLEAIEFLIADPIRYRVYLYATEIKDVNHAMVRDRYGYIGADELKALISKNAITVTQSGQFLGVLQKIAHTPEQFLKATAFQHINMIDLEEIGSKLMDLHAGLNEEGFKRAYGIVTEALRSLRLLMDNDEYRGSLLVVFTLAFGSVVEGGNNK